MYRRRISFILSQGQQCFGSKPTTTSKVCDTPITNNHRDTNGLTLNRHYRLMKTCSVQLKRHDQNQSDNRETNDKTKPLMTCCFH